MTFDLVIRNAALPDGRTGQDIALKDAKIAEIAPGLATDGPVIDAKGQLVSPPFVDAHFHIDATLSLGTDGLYNESGTLAEGISLWRRISPGLTAEDYRDRALRYCDMAVSKGVQAIRSHVDITNPDMLAAEVIAEIRREVAPYLDLQLVAFPQMGFHSRPDMADSVRKALDMGFEVVGGIPHLEPTAELGRSSITALCEIAAERGAMVDMHCDENDDPNSRMIETLIYETRRLDLQGRVTGSHLTSMHSMDNFYANRLIGMMADSGLHVMANPPANLHLQARFDTYPKRRGLTRVPELRAAGCVVGFAQDSVLDPWYPLGHGDLLDVAWIAAHACHMTDRAGLRGCFDAVTTDPARIMGLGGDGLVPGAPANLVLLEATDPIDAIRTRATRTHVIRRGKLICETAPPAPKLSLDGRPDTPARH
jgi:cytosine deaminase